MVFEVELEELLKIALIFVLSGVVGLEREASTKPAGLRTHILVGMASTLLTIVSIAEFPSEAARIAAAIIIGMGFLGAGTILKSQKEITGLTTAASLWVTAAIGITVGTGYYILAILTVAITYITLKLKIFE